MGVRRVMAMAIALASIVGCGPTLGVRGGLAERARTALRCAPYQIHVLQLARDAFEVEGCGRMVEYTDTDPGNRRHFVTMIPAALLAARDLGCAFDAMQSPDPRPPTQRTFIGCGQSATYALQCAPGVGCAWVRDTTAPSIVVPAPVAPPVVPASTPASTTPASTVPASTDDVVVPPPPGAT